MDEVLSKTKKFVFEIDHAGEHEKVKFSIEASSEEEATKFAQRLNPGARIVSIVESTVTGGMMATFPRGFIW